MRHARKLWFYLENILNNDVTARIIKRYKEVLFKRDDVQHLQTSNSSFFVLQAHIKEEK